MNHVNLTKDSERLRDLNYRLFQQDFPNIPYEVWDQSKLHAIGLL